MGGCLEGFGLLAPRTMIMGRYAIEASGGEFLGEGCSGVVRKGTCLKTGMKVAIKEYKDYIESVDATTPQGITVFKQFLRQLEVFRQLAEPFTALEFKGEDPSSFFVELVDYSKDVSGLPGADPETGKLYVVTKQAQYSLQDYVKFKRTKRKSPAKEEVQQVAKSLVSIVAALHAKGFVHLDLKPQNLMVFDGRLKLIDLDGCVEIGTSIRTTDTWFSFSLLYCAPEFARFVASRRNTSIAASSHLDAWSVGMTIAEVACLKPVLYSRYKHHKDMEAKPGAGDIQFMDWLGSCKAPHVPESLKVFDPELFDFLSDCLCVHDPGQRMSLRRCASHPYIAAAGTLQMMASHIG